VEFIFNYNIVEKKKNSLSESTFNSIYGFGEEFLIDNSIKHVLNSYNQGMNVGYFAPWVYLHYYFNDFMPVKNRLFVAWVDYKSGLGDIYGAFVDTSGVCIDSPSIPIARGVNYAYDAEVCAKVASSGNTIYVVFGKGAQVVYWQEYKIEELNGILLDSLGNPITPIEVLDDYAAGEYKFSWDIVYDNGRYYVAWQSPDGARGMRIDENGGVLLDPVNGTYLNFGGQWIKITKFKNGKFLVTGLSHPGDSVVVVGVMVDTAWNVLWKKRLTPVFYCRGGYIDENYYDICFDDDDNKFIICYSFPQSSYVAPDRTVICSVDTLGNIVDTPIVMTFGSVPQLAYKNGKVLLCYSYINDQTGITGRLYDSNLNLLNTFSLNPQNAQILNEVLFYKNHFYILFTDNRNSDADVYIARVDTNGNLIDNTGKAISFSGNQQFWQDAAFNGTDNYLVVWHDNRNNNWDIYGSRIGANGSILDTNAFPIINLAGNQGFPKVSFDGTNYFVIWNDTRYGGYDIFGTRVSQNGDILDPYGIYISQSSGTEFYSDIAFDGTNYLVVYDELEVNDYDIYAKRVGPDGQIIDDNPIIVCSSSNDQIYPKVIFTGNYYFVVWIHDTGSDRNIYGARILPDGTVVDTNGFLISGANNLQDAPDLAYDGKRILVVWADARDYSNNGWDIYGARVLEDGTVLDPDGFKISHTQGWNWEIFPSVTFDGEYFVVSWMDTKNYWDYGGNLYDIYGALVDTNGVSFQEFSVATNWSDDQIPVVIHGKSRSKQILFTYVSFADSVGIRPCYSSRIKAKISFPSDDQPPSIPVLISPNNNDTLHSYTVNFVWHPSGDAGSGIYKYILEYANDINFSNPVTIDVYDTSYVENITVSDSIFYWHVKAVDNAFNESSWSSVWKFYILGVDVKERSNKKEVLLGIRQTDGKLIFYTLNDNFRGNLSVIVTDVSGRVLKKRLIRGERKAVFKLPAGIYFYTVRYNDSVLKKGKIVLAK